MENNLNNKSSKKTFPIICAIIGHSIWGFSYLFTRIALNVSSPESLLICRFSIAFIILNIMMLTGKYKLSLRGKSIKLLLLFSILEPIYFYLESYGILYTNVTYSGVILAVVPIVAMIFAAVFLRELPTCKQALFGIIPIIGVIIMTLSGNKLGIISPLGTTLLLLTLVVSAIYRTLNKKLANEYSSFERTYCMIAISTVFFIIAGLIKEKGNIIPLIAPFSKIEFIIPVIILSTFCSVLCHNIVNYAAGKLSVMTLSIYGTLTTICSTFSGVIFLDEPITPTSFIGSALIIIGVWFTTKQAQD